MSRHFRIAEFSCRCGCGLDYIEPMLINRLDAAREEAGIPFRITSGVRCVQHNRKVGGKANSAHIATANVPSMAADIYCATGKDRWLMVGALSAAGFRRIGISSTFIHVDVDDRKPQDVIWTY